MKTRAILFLSDSQGVSGAELVLVNIMKSLNRDKFTPFVYCSSENRTLLRSTEKLGIKYLTTTKFPQVEAIGKPGIRPSKVLAYMRAIVGIYSELTHFLKTENIDILYANAYPCCLYCLLPAVVHKKPLIWHVHNIRRIHMTNSFVYRTAGAVSRKIITVSNACRRNLQKARISPSKMMTIYNGIDIKRFNKEREDTEVRREFGISPHTPVIGLFAQPIREKGHIYFIEAAAEVVKISPESKFLVVGYLYKSDYQRSLENLVEKLNLKRNIIFTGWRQDVPDVMASVNVVAHTRTTPEPAALVLMEAMAMGKPVVSSNTGGTPELIVDQLTGLLVPPKNSKALAEGIIHLLKNPDKAKQMGLNGRQRVKEKFKLDRQIFEIESILGGLKIPT